MESTPTITETDRLRLELLIAQLRSLHGPYPGYVAELEKRIAEVCKRIYRVLGISGYARMDLRLTADGRIYFLEANPNPNLSHGEDFAESAEKLGIMYPDLLQKIVTLGTSYRAAWALAE